MTAKDDSDLIFDGPEDAPTTVVLAHGAGAPMNTPFMNSVARGLASGGGVRVVRFEFPYMRAQRALGRRRAPNGAGALLESWREAIAAVGEPAGLVIGGKSMGGRIASMLADDVGARGLLVLGYPFHAPGRPGQLRVEHLAALRTPALICQGERDPFGTRAEVEGYVLSPAVRLHWLPDGDHSFVPRRSSGRSEEQNLREAVAASIAFIESLPAA